jgi:hypothetical protein
MAEPITFPIRLTKDDWQAELRAWRCPPLDIPGAKIEDAFDAEGTQLSTNLLKADKGPARVSYRGPGPQPSRIVVVIKLSEELSPSSVERFWKRLAIVVPIISALITGAVTLQTGPSRAGDPHVLRMRVDPLEIEASTLPLPRILVNSQEERTPIEYKVTSDVMAIIDVSKALDAAKTLRTSNENQQTILKSARSGIENLDNKLQSIFAQVDALSRDINNDVCSGGSNGVPIWGPARERMNARASAISTGLRSLSSELRGLVPPSN